VAAARADSAVTESIPDPPFIQEPAMTSLTALTTPSSLLHLSAAELDATHTAGSDTMKPLHRASQGAKALCAVMSFVISISLLGGVAVGMTTPTTAPSVIADAEPVCTDSRSITRLQHNVDVQRPQCLP
jgi:hypothetical protein